MFKVYLVDDENYQLKCLNNSVNWAEHGACVVGSQTNSCKAYDEILSMNPDIVITDVGMPIIDGFKLIKRLQDEGFAGAFVLISTYTDYKYVQKALRYNVVDYCLKPYENKTIACALERAKKEIRNRKVLKAFTIASDDICTNELYSDVMEYINCHFSEDLTLQMIADKFYVNASYLSKIFKNEAGVTFTAYLSNLRLEMACMLLKDSKLQVTEIADKIGFKNYFYFARVFKKNYDMTPSSYRQFDKIPIANVN